MASGLRILPGTTRNNCGLIVSCESGLLDARVVRTLTSSSLSWGQRQAVLFTALCEEMDEITANWLRERAGTWTLDVPIDEDAARRGWLRGTNHMEIIFESPKTALLFKLSANMDDRAPVD